MKVGNQNLNYQELQSEIHANAVKKGFWEKPNYHAFVADITEEIGEFIKALKAGRVANVVGYESDLFNEVCYLLPNRPENDRVAQDRKIFELRMKDTTGDELSDIDMLTMSIAEGWGIKIDKSCFPKSDMVLSLASSGDNVFVMINRLSHLVSKLAGAPIGSHGENPVLQLLFCQVLYSVEFIADYLEIDLEYHIRRKMYYNKDRPYLHGKVQ